jgi:RNA polymerase sigma-70 factor (sigma-E family)
MSTDRPRAYPGYTTNRQHPSRQTSDGDPAETWPAYRRHCELACRALMAKTYLAWGKINDHAALDAYVRRAMVNTHISWWRRRRLEEFPTDEVPDQAVADHARGSDMAEVVRRPLDRLPQRMRTAVVLRYFEDMTEPEIAAALGISLGTVKSTVSRAVAKLRIDAELGEDSDA